jgi:hypothetical protein
VVEGEDQGEEDQGEEDQGEEDQGEEDQGEEDQGEEDQGEEDQGEEDQGEDHTLMEIGPKVPTKTRKDADAVDCHHYVHVCLRYHNLVEFVPQA